MPASSREPAGHPTARYTDFRLRRYPIPPTKINLETLRGITHMRPRTGVIGAVMRVRNSLAYATHTFFQKSGFMYVHAPLITGADCEGAGEMFQVADACAYLLAYFYARASFTDWLTYVTHVLAYVRTLLAYVHAHP